MTSQFRNMELEAGSSFPPGPDPAPPKPELSAAESLEVEKGRLERYERENARLLNRIAVLSREVTNRGSKPILDIDQPTSARISKMAADASKAVMAVRLDIERQLEAEREALVSDVIFTEHVAVDKAVAKTTIELRKRLVALGVDLAAEILVGGGKDEVDIFCVSKHAKDPELVDCAYSSALREDILDLMNKTYGRDVVTVRLCEDHFEEVTRMRDLQIVEIGWDPINKYQVIVRRGYGI